MALAQQGHIMLHASSVVGAAGAVVILGESGAGKSTLAAYLGTQGRQVLSEDVLRLTVDQERVVGHPEYSEFRLWPESIAALFAGCDAPDSESVAEYTSKRRIKAHSLGAVKARDREAEICAIVSLAPAAPDATPVIRRLDRSEAFRRMVDALFRLDVRDPALAKREFRFIADLSARKPFFEIEAPRSFPLLPRVASLLMATADAPLPGSKSGD